MAPNSPALAASGLRSAIVSIAAQRERSEIGIDEPQAGRAGDDPPQERIRRVPHATSGGEGLRAGAESCRSRPYDVTLQCASAFVERIA
jgi:hypothetical protein